MSRIAVHNISPNPEQPRRTFDQAELEGLAASMAGPSGLIQPITVDRRSKNKYVLVDGERRWRAAKLLGWTMIEAYIRNNGHDPENQLLDAMVANIQKASMSLIEEARAYKKLMGKVGSGTRVAELVGVSDSTVYSKMQLLDFDEQIQTWFDQKKLPFECGAISALQKLPADVQLQVARASVMSGASARSIKLRCKRFLIDGQPAYNPTPRKPKDEPVIMEGDWNVLVFAQSEISPAIGLAARSTCQRCALYEDASVINCKQCPLVEFLKVYEVVA